MAIFRVGPPTFPASKAYPLLRLTASKQRRITCGMTLVYGIAESSRLEP